ncbi:MULTISPECIES: aminopeptidase P family protein [Myroides]|uniref:Xaa-Pro aminopeptidase n=1 Tax=Myroides albus TaxID=2562892 RepID=A0A6I3LM13_9FLAO|nr:MULTISPECIES: aminopeptidase P family protein [Myroides]MTG97202.1 M24 family metallopeptidase [Myroides albus]MVX35199.1 M24 family metallopeptidase [Myroides sp. LoEW2-1]
MFNKDTYIKRRQNLVNNVQSKGILLFFGNIENPVNFEDNTYHFRQDSTFLYYFGIQQPKLAAIIDLDENKSIVFGNEMSIDEIVWMGRQETLKDKCEKSGVLDVRPYADLATYLATALSVKRPIHYLPPYQSVNKILLSELLQISLGDFKASVAMIQAIVKQREIKESQEIEQIESALKVSTQMHLLAMQMARPGAKEYEIVSAIEHVAGSHNCELAYPSIVTVNGGILHNHYKMNTLESGRLLLNDSGCETSMGYASDLTRTYPVDKTFTSEQRDLYNIVLNSFEGAKAELKAGVKYKNVHLKACEILAQGLIDFGLMKGNAQDAVANHAHTMFFQCGLGHMMGLDVHDMEDLGEQYVGYTAEEPKDTKQFGIKSLRLGKELKAGHVLTVEPGIYFIPELIEMWQAENKYAEFINYEKLNKFKDFGGIRIEDNFLINNDGYKHLGPELIKTVTEIEDYKRQF